jgi:4-diphosphocytidyl-2-C-methyl-D-erythritol kinase
LRDLRPALTSTVGAFFMSDTLSKNSACKVNLLLNILGKRPDGFHELETVMQPINLHDYLQFTRVGSGIRLACSDPGLPTDAGNLVYRAAAFFLQRADIHDGVHIELIKNIPLAAGLGGGSGNAATTLLALNELFDQPFSGIQLQEIAASLGSDIPFFLQSKPAMAVGRGEKVSSLEPFPALRGAAFLLIHPGFGVSTAWAYQQLARFPAALHGQPGRARKLVSLLQSASLRSAAEGFYNSLEAPVLSKYPLLALYQEFIREQRVPAVLMSGSGSTTFAIAGNEVEARQLQERVNAKFGPCWTAVVPV